MGLEGDHQFTTGGEPNNAAKFEKIPTDYNAASSVERRVGHGRSTENQDGELGTAEGAARIQIFVPGFSGFRFWVPVLGSSHFHFIFFCLFGAPACSLASESAR